MSRSATDPTACSLLHSVIRWVIRYSVSQFSHSGMSDSLWPHGLQHARPPCPSPTSRIYPNSHPLSQSHHPTISSSAIPFSCRQLFPASGSVLMSQLFTSCPKVLELFSISLSNEYSGLISFRIDWFDLLAVQDTLKSLLQHHSWKAPTSIIGFMSGEFWGHQNQ